MRGRAISDLPMYCDYFKLTELPFTLAPNPRFVYLTNSHREALAHLIYGVTNAGGFVQVTGEVGAGKTTICRTLLRQLPDNVDVVLLFNPEIDRRDLLTSLAAELNALESQYDDSGNTAVAGDEHTSTADPAEFVLGAGSSQAFGAAVSTKTLADIVHRSLLRLHRRGRRAVLIIDEAQNLSREVLESLRLLTNLETDEFKLLQIVLVGQPELRDMLARPDLRQLAQRITAAYHLEGMSFTEMTQYVEHRLAVAGCQSALFSEAALKRIHDLTGGIPRLINLLCDRALLAAFSEDCALVDIAQLRRAEVEVGYFQIQAADNAPPRSVNFASTDSNRHGLSHLLTRSRPEMRSGVTPLIAAILAIGLSLVGLSMWHEFEPTGETPLAARVEPASAPAPGAAHAQEQAAEAVVMTKNEDVVAPKPIERTESIVSRDSIVTDADVAVRRKVSLVPSMSRAAAEARLAANWGLLLESVGSLCVVAQFSGARCLLGEGSLDSVLGLGRPAILRVSGNGDDQFVVLRGIADDAGREVLSETADGEVVQMSRELLDNSWRGEFLILWQSPLLGIDRILPGQDGTTQRWLRAALQRWRSLSIVNVDGATEGDLRAQVEVFQRARGIEVDGIAGPETLAHLSSVLRLPREPALIQNAVD